MKTANRTSVQAVVRRRCMEMVYHVVPHDRDQWRRCGRFVDVREGDYCWQHRKNHTPNAEVDRQEEGND